MSIVRTKSPNMNIWSTPSTNLSTDNLTYMMRIFSECGLGMSGVINSLVKDEMFFRCLDHHFMALETQRSTLKLNRYEP